MVTNPYELIVRLLVEEHIPYEIVEHEPVYTSEQAAAVRGVSLSQGAKSLLFKTKTSFALVVVPGDKRVDSRKLKQLLGVSSIRFASPDEVAQAMGCAVGSCYPLGCIAALRTLVDGSLGQNDVISFNPGRHDLTIKVRSADYLRLAQPEIVQVIE